MIRLQREMYKRIKNRYGCNDYFDLERNHLSRALPKKMNQTEKVNADEIKGVDEL